MPRLLLRLEGAALAIGAVYAYHRLGGNWWLFAALILAPDLGLLGYLIGTRIGAIAYNALHVTLGPLACAALGFLLPSFDLIAIALIWAAHIGIDRAIGLGLKYGAGFGITHLGRIGGAMRGLGDLARCPQDEDQHLGDGAIEPLGNILAEFDLRQRLGERGILLDRHAMLARETQDRLADLAAALGDDARHRHGGLVVLQRDGERELHVARSMKRPGVACRATEGGAPTLNWKSAAQVPRRAALRSARPPDRSIAPRSRAARPTA